ncbi:hypothetical protein DY000_02022919 [Brassica cretica]|uniref:Uncharacterized protein n=1 Tax=Brassica cretica TaxID=69181 RepID=A0ABQ7EGG1_BRACR|nr:hypothetical protein DY000_02022919 [Brassica cretica]
MMIALAKREERSDDKSGRNGTRVATREEDRIGRVTTLEVSTSFSSPIFSHSLATAITGDDTDLDTAFSDLGYNRHLSAYRISSPSLL